MKFSDSFLDEIRARLPVSQVVSRRVALKRRGREFVGLSPFNREKTPSFTVNDQKGFYHCFSSGKHGDVFTFLMETEGLSFPEAVERLAGEAGLELPKPDPQFERAAKERLGLFDGLEAAARFFEEELRIREGREALSYAEGRGLSAETLREFRIGFAPNSKDALKSALLKKGFTEAQLLDAGLLIKPADGRVTYDRFRNRLTIAILDAKSRVIAFGARALDPATEPKYLNSPETRLFDKGSTVFNFARARKAAFDSGELVVVEGYMDVIALNQAGFTNAVAWHRLHRAPDGVAVATCARADHLFRRRQGGRSGCRARDRPHAAQFARRPFLPLRLPAARLRSRRPYAHQGAAGSCRVSRKCTPSHRRGLAPRASVACRRHARAPRSFRGAARELAH
jgi:DNA primase